MLWPWEVGVKVAALLLAAGESTRMGTPKPLLPWGGTTLVAYQVEQLLAGGVCAVVVVIGHEAERVRTALRGHAVRIVQNPEYRLGRASSVRHGVAALPVYAEAALVLNVDQPRPAEVVRGVIAGHQEHGDLISIPTYQGKRGHPTVFAGFLFPEMGRVTEQNQGLREVVQRHADRVHLMELGHPLVVQDMNTPEDYERVRARFGMGT